jgi:tetratricopeptide (TPR) repeat protein
MNVENVSTPRLIARATSAARADEVQEAEALYREVLARYPANRRAQEGLAKLKRQAAQAALADLTAMWQVRDADGVIRRSEGLERVNPTVRDLRGAALRRLGRYEEALAIYDAGLKADPENAGLWFNAGVARMDLHLLSEAEQCLAKACTLDPRNEFVVALIKCKVEQGYYQEAETLASTLLERPSLDAQAIAAVEDLRGSALMNLGDTDAAREAFERTLSLMPTHPVALRNMGILAMADGDRVGAAAAYRRALAAEPENASLHRYLSGALRYTPEEPHLQQLRTLLEKDLATEDAAELRFAMAKAEEDLGDLAAAAENLTGANGLRRKALQYRPEMPLNFRWAELMLAALPEARVVWLERAPLANAFSLYRHCFAASGNGFAYDAKDIATTIASERALRARIKERFRDRVHVLSLKRMTETPEPVIRDLVAFCDLEWSDRCLAPQDRDRAVLTASSLQIRRTISVDNGARWAKYAPHLPQIPSALAAAGLPV